ncbi:MAG TPA: NAD(P)-dependent oxidoreductase, partial [Pyrinomonadaceae bacterium]|nr:NAD(P)-dependent oxidoreductase [Pyrinomonadaceae bacterium]
VARYAAAKGHDVLGIGRAAQPESDWPGAYLSADVITADLSGTIRDFAPDAIVHAAGTASVGASFSAPIDDLRASLLSWANVLNAVRRSSSQPLLLFPSSGAVYGQPGSLPVSEDAPVNPISPYGFHKAACELLAREYADCFAQRVVVCRLFSVFGPGQRRLLPWELYKQFAGPDEVVWLQGSGAETRDYLSITDLADALVQLIENQESILPSPGCRVVNVASGVETPVLDLAKQIGKLVAPQKEIACRGLRRAGDPERWQADISQVQNLLPAWKPRSLEQTLGECVAAWQES